MKTNEPKPNSTSTFNVRGSRFNVLILLLLAATGSPSAATVRYVWQGSPSPGPPYDTWASAAHDIQTAVDAAVVGDEVVVSNGIYATGGRAVGTNVLVNRVAVDKPVTVRSVNGPTNTIIRGYQAPGTTNGDGAIRCVYLTNGASLSGFTLTNGATRDVDDYPLYRESSGGGVWCESTNAFVTNSVIAGNSAYGNGGGAFEGTLDNCKLTANSALKGGGACNAKLKNCTLIGNSASAESGSGSGGGAYDAMLMNCTLAANSAWRGGGVAGHDGKYHMSCMLLLCTLTGNSANIGGGAFGATLNKCMLTGNSATDSGGGAYASTLNNCALTGNSAQDGAGAANADLGFSLLNNCTLTGNFATNSGGGAYASTLNNCTLVGNSAGSGGGAYWSTLNNCIVYSNTAADGANYTYDSTLLNYCCTTPQPDTWQSIGNITNAPQFVNQASGNLRLQSNSPCINAGNNSYLTNYYFTNLFDLDGLPRIVRGTVDIGAYEFQGPGSVISYAWLQHYGLPTDGSADSLDPDGDGMSNWQEWRADTIPTDALSVLRMVTVTNGMPGLQVIWQSVPTRTYWLERGTNLASPPSFSSLASDIVGQVGTTTYEDTTATNGGPFFYRVAVGN